MQSPCLAVLFLAFSAACAAQTATPQAPSTLPARTARPGLAPESPIDQFAGGVGPDGRPAAVASHGCVFSKYFGFSYRLPAGMTSSTLAALPAGGTNVSASDFILFVEDRVFQTPNYTDDVAEAAAEYRGKGQDASASNFLLQLRNPTTAPNGSLFDDLDARQFGGQHFSRLRMQLAMPGGLFTYESIYATEMRGYVVHFLFKSLDPDALSLLEQSMSTFALGNQCTPNS